jgi:hypothetical protein
VSNSDRIRHPHGAPGLRFEGILGGAAPRSAVFTAGIVASVSIAMGLILAPSPARSAQPATAPSWNAARGMPRVYVDGNAIDPPYVFAVIDSMLVVNDYVLVPAPRPGGKSGPPAFDSTAMDSSLRLLHEVHATLNREGVPPCGPSVRRALEILASSPCVRGVRVIDSSNVEVRFTNSRFPETLSFGAPVPVPPFSLGSLWDERQHYDEFVNRRGGLICVSGSTAVLVPAPFVPSTRKEIERARSNTAAWNPDSTNLPRVIWNLLGSPRPLRRVTRRRDR